MMDLLFCSVEPINLD